MVTTRQFLAVGMLAIAMASCGSNGAVQPAGTTPAQSSPRPAPSGPVPPALRSTIAATLKVDESKVTPGASFAGDLQADALAMVELVMAYERTFKIDIPNADAARFRVVQDVAGYLHERGVLR